MFERLDQDVPNGAFMSEGTGSSFSEKGSEAPAYGLQSPDVDSYLGADVTPYCPQPTDVPSLFAVPAEMKGAWTEDRSPAESTCPEPQAAPQPSAATPRESFHYSKTIIPARLGSSGDAEPEPEASILMVDPEASLAWEGLSLEQLKGVRGKLLSMLYNVSESIRREEVRTPSTLGPLTELTEEEKVVVNVSLHRLLVEAFHPLSVESLKEMYVFAKSMRKKETKKMEIALQCIHRLTNRGKIIDSYRELQDFLRSPTRFTADWREEFVSAIRKVLAMFLNMSEQPGALNGFYPQLLLIARHEVYYTILLRAAQGEHLLKESAYHLSPEWLAATHACKCTLQQLLQSFSSGTTAAGGSLPRNSQSPASSSNPTRRPYIGSSMRWNPPRVRPKVPCGASPRITSCDSSVDRSQTHTEHDARASTPSRSRRALDTVVRRQFSGPSVSALRSPFWGKVNGANSNGASAVAGGRVPLSRMKSSAAGALARSPSAARHMDPWMPNFVTSVKVGRKPVSESPKRLQRTVTQCPSILLSSVKNNTKPRPASPCSVRLESRSRPRTSHLLTPRK